MDNPNTPNSSPGTSDTETYHPARSNTTQRAYEGRKTDTSVRESGGSTYEGDRSMYRFSDAGLPPIAEIPDTEQDAAYEDASIETPGLGLTPLTGMSSELQGTSTGFHEMEFGEIVVSGDELHDSDANDALDAIWAVNEITNIAIITALKNGYSITLM